MARSEGGGIVKEVFQGRETMGWGMLVCREVTSMIAMTMLEGEGPYDMMEIVGILDV